MGGYSHLSLAPHRYALAVSLKEVSRHFRRDTISRNYVYRHIMLYIGIIYVFKYAINSNASAIPLTSVSSPSGNISDVATMTKEAC